MILVGLAQRFLEDQLASETGAGKGTVLEVKEDIGLGTTVDAIIYSGILKKEDTIIFGTRNEPLVTKIKALLKPKLNKDGLYIKADTIGSLEALVKESQEKGINIRKVEIGNISRRDIMETASLNNPLERVIFAFNVKILPEAKEELTNTDVTVFNEDVIYTIIENYDIWQTKKKRNLRRNEERIIRIQE